MNFSRLKLTEGISSSNNLATNAEAKTSEMASGIGKQKQMNPAAKEQQIKQRAARTGPTTMNNTVDVAPVATTTESYLDTLHKVQLEKAHRHHTHNWRKELAEAVNPDDDPQHPYVEIMPHFKYKEKEAKKNAGKAAMKDRANGEPPLTTGVNEEMLTETPEGVTGKRKTRISRDAKKLAQENKKSLSHAKKARTYFKKQTKAFKKGDEKERVKYEKKARDEAQKARKSRSSMMKNIPFGSRTYSNKKAPTAMNKKFHKDMKSQSGREEIVARTENYDAFSKFEKFVDEAVDPLKYHLALNADSGFDHRMRANNLKYNAKRQLPPAKSKKSKEVKEESINAKKDSGKAVPMSRGVRNADNTATPKENVLRRKVNANPDMRGKAGKAAVDRMMKEQSMADAKKRRQNLTIETGMRRRQANPEMPKPNLDNAKSNHGA